MADISQTSPGRIFISYRREETAYPAGWLYDRLADRFGASKIFKDIDSIELGDDFVEVITSAVGSCDVLLALIGNEWLTITGEDGRRRLDDPADFVRVEIEAALARDVRVIPVLVDGASMPRAEDLPTSLAKLVRRQALELSPSRFDFDTGRLLRVLERTLAEVQAKDAATAPTPPVSTAPDEALAGSPSTPAPPEHTGAAPTPTVPPGGPSAEAIGAPSGELAGVEQARVNTRRRRVFTAATAGAVVVAAGVTAALVLLPSDDPQRTDATDQTEPTQQTEPTERTLEIPSTQLWTDTDVDCETGDVLDISATGTVLHNKEDLESAVDPNGLTDPIFHQYNVPGLPDANTAGLIGSIDREQPFFVGTGTTYECPGAGRLFLGINDLGVANNSGEFIATIEQRHDN